MPERSTAVFTALIVFIALAVGLAAWLFVLSMDYDDLALQMEAEEKALLDLRLAQDQRNREEKETREKLEAKKLQLTNVKRRLVDTETIRDNQRTQRDATQQKVSPAEKDKHDLWRKKLEEVKEEERRLAEAKKQFGEEKKTYQENITKERDTLSRTKELSRSETEKFLKEQNNIRGERTEIEARLKKVLGEEEKRKELAPDGRTLLFDQETRLAVVDIGWVHGLREGMRFDVYTEKKGGEKVRKGKVEVREVRAQTATCILLPPETQRPACPQCSWEAPNPSMRYCPFCTLGENNDEVQPLDRERKEVLVVAMDPLNPIVPGDFISNPYYSCNMKLIFVLGGEMVHHTKREVTLFIEENSGVVADELTLDTDFLIAGTGPGANEALKRARTLGVKVLREEDLFKFFGKKN